AFVQVILLNSQLLVTVLVLMSRRICLNLIFENMQSVNAPLFDIVILPEPDVFGSISTFEMRQPFKPSLATDTSFRKSPTNLKLSIVNAASVTGTSIWLLLLDNTSPNALLCFVST